ncbi:hypothetical protein RJ55_02924 [Drechmeria coniospora]|nr:hypothetical protein RJ55_02924 [Drechmeria coniospora]
MDAASHSPPPSPPVVPSPPAAPSPPVAPFSSAAPSVPAESSLPVGSAAIAPLSIAQILRLHCRERLLVRPSLWTDRHLELLQCSFSGPSPAPCTPTPVLFEKQDSGGGLKYTFEEQGKTSPALEVLLDVLLRADSSEPFLEGFSACLLTFPPFSYDRD